MTGVQTCALPISQAKSVGRVSISNDGSSLTGVLVTKCHFITSLHAISHLNDESAARPSGKLREGALALTDVELSQSNVIGISIGFLPTEAPGSLSTFGLVASAHIVKTGRLYPDQKYELAIPEYEDWLIAKIKNPKLLSAFVPFEIASDDEILHYQEKSLVLGYPDQLIRSKGLSLYIGRCLSATDPYGLEHSCIVTAGNSGSPIFVNVGGSLKIVGLVSAGLYHSDGSITFGVKASAFREAVSTLSARDPCE